MFERIGNFFIFLLCFLPFFATGAETVHFQGVMKGLEKHPYVKEAKFQADKVREVGREKGSWGDPQLGLSAQRVPLHSLSLSEHERTEMMASLSQKLSLSGHFSKLEDSFKRQAKGAEFGATDRLRELRVLVWKTFVERKSLLEQKRILRENLAWIEDMIKVSQNLYSNGTIGQQNLFDLETRKAEIESQLVEIRGDIEKNAQEIHYLSQNSGEKIVLKSVPWEELKKFDARGDRDFKEKQLKKNIEAADLAIESKRRGVIPDPTLSVSYMRMDNSPMVRDMVGVSLKFPLPFSSEKYARIDREVKEKRVAENRYRNYKKEKRSNLHKLSSEINSLADRLKILRGRSLRFAESSREVTAKAYQRGNVTYKELQTSELKLQELKVREQVLWEKWQKKRIDRAYLAGERLYD